ncbi:MAG: hypothetical protein HQL70_07910 [Magnetococcales bacterium]|nr:hypothetical protein [Magnetococcales bacterium]
MPLLLSQPFTTPGGWVAPLFVGLALLGSRLKFRLLLQQLKRLRWLFFALIAFHAFLTPGEPLFAGFSHLSHEGAEAGAAYSMRLVLMISLSWILIRTTSHSQIVAGFRNIFGFLERMGLPLERGLALISFTLGRIPHLIHEAGMVREDLSHRLGSGRDKIGWLAAIYRMALAGEAMLFRLLRSAQAQEESLRARGISHGLPVILPVTGSLGWRDGVVLASSCVAFLISLQS